LRHSDTNFETPRHALRDTKTLTDTKAPPAPCVRGAFPEIKSERDPRKRKKERPEKGVQSEAAAS